MLEQVAPVTFNNKRLHLCGDYNILQFGIVLLDKMSDKECSKKFVGIKYIDTKIGYYIVIMRVKFIRKIAMSYRQSGK